MTHGDLPIFPLTIPSVSTYSSFIFFFSSNEREDKSKYDSKMIEWIDPITNSLSAIPLPPIPSHLVIFIAFVVIEDDSSHEKE